MVALGLIEKIDCILTFSSPGKFVIMQESQVSIGLINPKTPTNVGIVMRASGCYRVNSVFYTGERFERAVKFHTDTMQANKHIPLKGVDDLTECLPEDVKIVCVELVEGAMPLTEYQHPEKAIYIFGPEDGSISKKVINKADAVVYIPTIGCMNLAATVNVVLYDRLAKSNRDFSGDDLIRQSRDANNKIKVRKD